MTTEPKLFFNPVVKQLIDSFSFCFDVKITFYSLNMDEWLVGYHTNSSDYCTMIQQKLKIRYKCLHQDSMMCKKCGVLNRELSYRCHGGLFESLLPIRFDGKTIAFAMIGQYRMEKQYPATIKEAWKQANCDEGELQKAFHDRPLFSEERREKMLYIFRTTLEFLVNTENMTLKKPGMIEQVMDYVEAHMESPVTITAVSEALGKSPSTITHVLKQNLDISFKQLIIIQKLRKFDSILINDPSMTIAKACRMIGYDDSLYFSRLYKSKRNIMPSEYLESVRRSQTLMELDRSQHTR